MDVITKTFLTIVAMLMVAYTGMSMILASMNASRAEHFLTDVTREVEESNFQSYSMERCKAMAKERGYTLTIQPIDTDGDTFWDMADMQLIYPYVVPFLVKNKTDHVLRGYAR